MKRLLLLLLFFLSVCARAQFPAGRILHYTRKEGLSSSAVNSIVQDTKGFMWFATGDGLNRFDGVDFKVFKYDPEQQLSLPGNYVQMIFKDSGGKFWLSSRKGLYQFNPETEQFVAFSLASGAQQADVSFIMENQKKNLWVSTSGSGLFYLNHKTGKSINYSKKNLKCLSSNSILKVYEDTYGWLWVGTRDAGLNVFQVRDGKILKQIPVNSAIGQAGRVNSIYADHSGNIWMATSNGLWLYDRANQTYTKLDGRKAGLSSNVFLSLVEDSRQQLFIGLQDGGLYRIDLSGSKAKKPLDLTFEPFKYDNGYNITPRSVTELYLDRDENLWVGTYGDGFFMVSRTADKFTRFHKKVKDHFGENYLRYYGMCMDQEGYLWLGTDGDGIYKSKLNGEVVKHYRAGEGKNDLADNAVLYGYRDSKNRLWFGTYSKGLSLYNPKTDAFVNFKHEDGNAASLGGNDVRVIHEDSGHNIWIGTNGGGLSKFDPQTNKFTVYNTSNSKITSNDVRSLTHDEKGNLWIGTYGGGISFFSTAEQKFYPFLQLRKQGVDLSREIVLALFMDAEKRLWIGSEGYGLLSYDTSNKSLRRFSEKSGLANNTIYAIQQEAPGMMWVSTNDGLSKIDLQQNKIYNYAQRDGLQGGQFNPGSSISAADGSIMAFGGTEGWNLFRPKEIRQSTAEPAIRITGIQLYGNAEDEKGNVRNISESGNLELNAGEPVFSIQYVALNYAYPRAAQFAYKLEGLDKEWNYVRSQKSATYRYLDPGYYTFKVRATNQDGIWQRDFAILHIEILPPWYKTWWAFSVYLIIAGGLVYLLVRYKSNQARLKYNINIAKLEAQNEKELHENKLAFFTNISHEFRTPLTLIINPVKEILDDKDQPGMSSLTIVYRNAKRLLSLVDQLLLFSKAETKADKLKLVQLNLYALCEEVFLCFTYQASKKKITYEFTSPDKDIQVYGDREKIEIALFNLISNAIRHTPEEGKVSLSLSQDAAAVCIRVSDTGSGIDPEAGDSIFERFYKVRNNKNYAKGGFGVGLYLVKSFITQHHGKVCYQSTPQQCTTFSLTLLKGKAHFSEQPIFEDLPESSAILEELSDAGEEESFREINVAVVSEEPKDDLSTEDKTILIIDDNKQIRDYIAQLFKNKFQLMEADNGDTGLAMVKQYLPDMVISDVVMPGLNGVELCQQIKQDPALYHIPVVLLTANTSSATKLKGIECGADDYIGKPFEKELLIARIEGLLKNRNELQKYFYNEITLKSDNLKISAEYKQFLDRCIAVVEAHMTDPNFGIQMLADETGMSRSNLYIRIKSISGQSANSFIRFIRLRKAAEIFITTELTVQETSYRVGIKDPRYFREQFHKVFAMNPSDYIKKYRKTFNSKYSLNKSLVRSKSIK